MKQNTQVEHLTKFSEGVRELEVWVCYAFADSQASIQSLYTSTASDRSVEIHIGSLASTARASKRTHSLWAFENLLSTRGT